jgi:hypothetical protein
MNAPAAAVRAADTTRTRAADRRQAEYFRRLLHEQYLQLCDQIAGHQRLVIKYQNRDEPSQASRMRRILRDEERERDTVLRLIDALDARFFTDAPIGGTVPALLTVSPL